MGLRTVFPEKWLVEMYWKNRFREEDERCWRQLNSHFIPIRSLQEKELEKIDIYEKKYKKIKIYYLPDNTTFGGLGALYSFYLDDWSNSNEDTCAVLFVEGLIEGRFRTVNKYLTDKMQETFETITKETYPFWHAYLNRNRQQVIVVYEARCLRRSYEEAQFYFRTGKQLKPKKVFCFSDEEEQRGKNQMQALGINIPYICVFARDARYNTEMLLGENAGFSIRDSDISAFTMTTQHFLSESIQSVRMGACMKEAGPCDGLIDYANHGRDDFLDIFFLSKCNFFVSGDSGITQTTLLFGTPLGVINVPYILNFRDCTIYMDVGIFVKYYDPSKKRYLRLREIAEMQMMHHASLRHEYYVDTYSYDEYVAQHYEIVHNSPKEILDLAKEMDAIRNQTIQYTEYDERLQKRYRELILEFWSEYPPVMCPFIGRVGMQWLRDNEWFLE